MCAVKRPKVVLVTYYYPFDRAPSLQSLVRDLMRTHTVIIFADHRFTQGIPEDIDPLFKVFHSRQAKQETVILKDGKLKSFLEKVLPNNVKQFIIKLIGLKDYFLYLPRFCHYLRKESLCDVTIAADKGALFAALLSGKVPRLYYSLEPSPFWEEPGFLLFKALHIVEYLYVKLINPYVICQSEKRINLIQTNKNRQIIIPVTSSGEILLKKDYLRESLRIGYNKKILLIAGGLGPDQLTLEIMAQAKYWEDQYVLVLHSASGKYTPEVYSLACQEENKGRIFLSFDCLTIDAAEELIYSSADIGIVLYKDLGFNYRHTAFASGKLASFLRCGVPLIVPEFDEFKELLMKYRFGESACVKDISKKASLIFENYKSYEAEAYTAYNNIYRFSNYSGNVSRIINQKILSICI